VLSPEQHAVLRAIERCRTAALGGHMHVCDSCGYAVPAYGFEATSGFTVQLGN